jgi:hypothetical protein
MSTNTSHRIIVTLKVPTHVADMVKLAQAIVAALTGNASFPNPTPSLATVSSQITALDTAETAETAVTQTRAKGTVQTRNVARAALVTSLHQLKAYVQQVSDANPEQASAIIASAGLGVRKAASGTKAAFAATAGPVSGAMHLVAKAVAHRASYDWQWSSDGGKTWTSVPSTLQARTTITGLPVATTCSFRFRTVTKTGESDWSQPVALVVK